MSAFRAITRRSAMLGGVGTVAAGALWGRARAASAKPNILFILADDLGYADVSCYGRPDFKTPHVDRIASQGMQFMQAYANSAVCSATRAALITGRYQDRLDVGLDEPNGARPDAGLSPDHPTLSSLLKKGGYSTALIGKWHLGAPPKFGPLKSGYDHFYGLYGGGVDYFRHDALIDQTESSHDKGYITELFGDRAVSLIEGYASQPAPFFMSLHFTAPHWPWEGPTDQAESDRLAAKGPRSTVDYDGGTQAIFAAMVQSLDEQVGRVLDALERTGQAGNTIVVFTSDNGGERFSDTWPFNGKKGELLEGGLRVPAIVRWPGHIAPGSTSEQVIMSMDWLPTLIAAAGGRPDAHYPSDGMNVLKTLKGSAKPKSRKVFWRYNSLGQRAVRDGDWKYLKILDNEFLFNVVDDPLERANWNERDPKTFARLAADWEAWNKNMLPYTEANYSWTASGREFADHFGAPGATLPKRPAVEQQ